MTDFSAIDPNFRVEPAFSRDGLVFYDVTKPPFSVRGLLYEDGWTRDTTYEKYSLGNGIRAKVFDGGVTLQRSSQISIPRKVSAMG